MENKITKFAGEHFFLSNFYPCFIKHEGYIYPSVENAYQAYKTLDLNARNVFLDCKPNKAKKIGQTLTLRPNWDIIKVPLMKGLLYQKFNKPEFKELLLGTGDTELVEGNWWGDTFWGVCHGEGKNVLGTLLMELREDLYIQSIGESLT